MHAVADDSRLVALELHQLLADLDTAKPPAQHADVRLDRIREHLADLLDHTWPDDSLRALQERLAEIQRLIQDQTPEGWDRREWSDFRNSALPAYEALASSLRGLEIHVPSLRPTNVARNLYHVLNALLIVSLVELAFTPAWTRGVATAVFATAFLMETSRRVFPRINALLMKLFGRVAHPHEVHRVNSASWFALAILLLAWSGHHTAGVLGVAVLGFGDPIAALIGRRFGRVKLLNGRTLEGSLAFVAAGALAAGAVVALWHPELSWSVPLVAATFGASAELLARRIDDNLAIPLAASFGAWLAI